VTVLHLAVAAAGVFLAGLRMVLYVFYRKTAGSRTCARPRRRRGPSAQPDFEEFDYRTALVPIFGKDISASCCTAQPS